MRDDGPKDEGDGPRGRPQGEGRGRTAKGNAGATAIGGAPVPFAHCSLPIILRPLGRPLHPSTRIPHPSPSAEEVYKAAVNARSTTSVPPAPERGRMGALSLGLWPEEARKTGRVIRQDFMLNFAVITTLLVGVRILVWFVHGE